MDNIIEKVLEKLPRKIVGALTAMYLIGHFAQQGTDWKVLGMMTFVGVVGVGAHWFLEWQNPSNGAPDEN